ncbi:hypothetical protein AB0395_15640 [Streptosporangium sp. NPDC051023]
MGDHEGKPVEKEKVLKPTPLTKEQSDGRPDDGKHAKPSSK